MKNLDEAWSWCQSTRDCLGLFRRLGERYWNDLPWSGKLGSDDRFRSIEGPTVVERASGSLEHIDDLAVMVLFSVFESIVRDRLMSDVAEQEESIARPHVRAILQRTHDGIENGSFFRIVELYKVTDANLAEEVNQVRRYRNWVAHGKRAERPPSVSPEAAYDRLSRFLAALDLEFPDSR